LTGIDRHVELSREIYDQVLERGAPPATALDWWWDRMQMENERNWDKSLGNTSPEESGFA
jgi:hypothetical protein